MESLFKKVWNSVSPALQQVVDRFAFHVIEQNSEQVTKLEAYKDRFIQSQKVGITKTK